MPNSAKIQQVQEVADKLAAAKSAALIQYQGLNAAGVANLRQNIHDKGGHLEVVKNTLISRALQRLGMKLSQPLTGPTAIAYSNQDEIAPFKEIEKVSKDKDFITFKYGIFDKKLLEVADLKRFLSLPSKSTLIAQFVGGLSNPLQRLVYALRFNQTQLVLTLKAISSKQ
jgi:large subunit ribosomal protein L10